MNSRQTGLKRTLYVAALLTIVGLWTVPRSFAQATNTVNQGAPGHFGPWFVDVGTASATTVVNVVSFANTTATQTEVLVLNSASTATPTTPLAGRRSIEIQNRGPYSIFCKPGGTGALNTTREIRPGDAWSLDIGSAIAVGCRAATADQVTTAATIVTELK